MEGDAAFNALFERQYALLAACRAMGCALETPQMNFVRPAQGVDRNAYRGYRVVALACKPDGTWPSGPLDRTNREYMLPIR